MLCNCLSLSPSMGKDSQIMDKKELQAIAQAAAKNIKTEADLNEFRQMLTKITVETALNVEFTVFYAPFVLADKHLGQLNFDDARVAK